jgi:hypothetical protein
MRSIKNFNQFILENNSEENPIEKWLPKVGDKQKAEFNHKLFAKTEEGKRSLITDCMLEAVMNGLESGKRLKGLKFKAVQSLPGDENKDEDIYIITDLQNRIIQYTLYFITEDEQVVKRSNGYFSGREWILMLTLPAKVIYDLGQNPTKEQLDNAKKIIMNQEGSPDGGDWSLIDGMSNVRAAVPTAQGGWQLAWINDRKKDLVPAEQWKKEEKKETTTLDKLGKTFRTLMEWHPLKVVLDAITGDDDWRPWKYKEA